MNLGEYAASQANIFQLIADVPIDATQTRQLYFATESERDTYFSSKVVASGSNTNFKFIRKSRGLKVQTNENRIETCNYMRFKNTGGMWWYAFITSIEYVNPNTSMVYFVIDSFQTFFHQAVFKVCDISREHTDDATLWDCTVPEGVDYGDYFIHHTETFGMNPQAYILVTTCDLLASPRDNNGNPQIFGAYGAWLNRAPTSCDYYLFRDKDVLLSVIEYLQNSPWIVQNILGIYGIPTVAINGLQTANARIGSISCEMIIGVNNDFGLTTFTIDNWQGKFSNNITKKKLLTYPYSFIEILTPDGGSQIFKPQLIARNATQLSIQVRFIINPEIQFDVKLMNYDGSDQTDRQLCTLNCMDTPAYPVQNNQYFATKYTANRQYSLARQQAAENLAIGARYINQNMALSEAHHAIDLAGHAAGLLDPTSWMQGGVTGHVTGAAHTGVSMAQDYVSAQQQIETANRMEQQQAARDRLAIDSNQNGVTLAGRVNGGAMPINCSAWTNNIIVRFWSLTDEYISKVGGYFTMFGYKTNRIAIPTFAAGSRYHYIRCNSVNIYGDIPNVYLNELQNMFLDGITLWKDHANVGVYGNN